MDKEIKIFLGKILGEVYSLQKDNQEISEATIYGLKNGFEFVIDEEISSNYKINNHDLEEIKKILDPIFYDSQKLKDFKGYNDIEHELEQAGIGRVKAILLFTYFSKKGAYKELIEKLDSEFSPLELRGIN